VARGSHDRTSLDRAAQALREGEAVLVYPEGTVTKWEDSLPMEGKTGVVRLALGTGVPILPMASWGSQAVWQKHGRGSLRYGRPVWTKVGEPIHLDGAPTDAADLRALTADVMDGLTGLVVDLRDRYPSGWSG
jgi:1-acyl-sn-glycerol-3-phosphate acyltransferase